ncbi:hypothetical protein CDCA_CDCA17G4355 [Cyanidium caldarium]|uniref:Pre-rRNA-processing protein Ipi1 N-terminal domain-containing protein n=1 Tax=Cyanidium caldarium TaxID=2771 RepID=A0AAV9J1X3_CYACA|nr:hypothetical protein CDCA_CDCA17G4355 [Cyanidium caldarium]
MVSRKANRSAAMVDFPTRPCKVGKTVEPSTATRTAVREKRLRPAQAVQLGSGGGQARGAVAVLEELETQLANRFVQVRLAAAQRLLTHLQLPPPKGVTEGKLALRLRSLMHQVCVLSADPADTQLREVARQLMGVLMQRLTRHREYRPFLASAAARVVAAAASTHAEVARDAFRLLVDLCQHRAPIARGDWRVTLAEPALLGRLAQAWRLWAGIDAADRQAAARNAIGGRRASTIGGKNERVPPALLNQSWMMLYELACACFATTSHAEEIDPRLADVPVGPEQHPQVGAVHPPPPGHVFGVCALPLDRMARPAPLTRRAPDSVSSTAVLAEWVSFFRTCYVFFTEAIVQEQMAPAAAVGCLERCVHFVRTRAVDVGEFRLTAQHLFHKHLRPMTSAGPTVARLALELARLANYPGCCAPVDFAPLIAQGCAYTLLPLVAGECREAVWQQWRQRWLAEASLALEPAEAPLRALTHDLSMLLAHGDEVCIVHLPRIAYSLRSRVSVVLAPADRSTAVCWCFRALRHILTEDTGRRVSPASASRILLALAPFLARPRQGKVLLLALEADVLAELEAALRAGLVRSGGVLPAGLEAALALCLQDPQVVASGRWMPGFFLSLEASMESFVCLCVALLRGVSALPSDPTTTPSLDAGAGSRQRPDSVLAQVAQCVEQRTRRDRSAHIALRRLVHEEVTNGTIHRDIGAHFTACLPGQNP